MTRILTAAVAALVLSGPAWSQDRPQVPTKQPQPQAQTPKTGKQDAKAAPDTDSAAPDTDGAAKTAAAAEDSKASDADEKSILDDQTYGGKDDDFIPSEEIPVSQAIPFPTDI